MDTEEGGRIVNFGMLGSETGYLDVKVGEEGGGEG